MRWSKLKQRIEERFAESLKGRLEIFETVHRMGHHHSLAEIWMTLDKNRIFSTSDMKGWQRIHFFLDAGDDYEVAYAKVAAEGSAPAQQSNVYLFDTLSLSISDMISSDVVIVRALAVADARFGKRRMQAQKSSLLEDHPVISTICNARLARA